MQIHFQPEAEAELAEARVWYALQREGLDGALMQQVDEALQRIPRRSYDRACFENAEGSHTSACGRRERAATLAAFQKLKHV